MQFVYKPEGAEPKKWDFDPDRLMSPEAVAIERLTKLTFAEWTEAVQRGSVLALHALLYVMLKREIPSLKPSEIEFSMSEVDFELDDDETARVIAALEDQEKDGSLSPQDAATLELLRSQHADDAPAGDEDEAPKED